MNTLLTDPIVRAVEPKAKIEAIVEKQIEYKYVGSIKVKPGHILWQFNLETGELTPVPIENKISLNLNGKPIAEKKTTFNPKCLYLSALHRNSAEKKVEKIIEEYKRKNPAQ
jgi:hypothetical protein